MCLSRTKLGFESRRWNYSFFLPLSATFRGRWFPSARAVVRDIHFFAPAGQLDLGAGGLAVTATSLVSLIQLGETRVSFIFLGIPKSLVDGIVRNSEGGCAEVRGGV